MGWLLAAWLLLVVAAIMLAVVAFAGFESNRTEGKRRRPGYIVDGPENRSGA